jgi:peroxiredoxin
MFTRGRRKVAVPEVGADAPEFNLPSAQGGQLRLSMRTARGPVVVVFFRGLWSEEDVEYFQALAAKEDEINLAAATVVGIGLVEPDESREFVRASGIKSMVLYDYVRVTTRQWGLLEKDKEHGEYARPAVFIVGTDHKVAHAWTDGRPAVDEIMAKITEMTGLPKPAEEADEEKPRRPKKAAGTSEASPGQAAPADDKPQKMSKEERERIKAERRAAREAGKSVKSAQPEKAAQPEQEASSEEPSGGEQAPQKMSKEERERIKAERRAAREAGKSLKKPEGEKGQSAGEEPPDEAREG